jgi:hypothetical protein
LVGRNLILLNRSLLTHFGEGIDYADAEIVRSNKTVIGVEVELTRKRQERIVQTMEHLAQRYEGIWYFTKKQTQGVVLAAMRDLPPDWQKKFRVHSLEEVEQRPE